MTKLVEPLTRPVRDQIHAMANREGISYIAGPLDQLANAITAHCGDEVTLDSTEELIIALDRAGIVGPLEATFLHAAYMRERDR